MQKPRIENKTAGKNILIIKFLDLTNNCVPGTQPIMISKETPEKSWSVSLTKSKIR